MADKRPRTDFNIAPGLTELTHLYTQRIGGEYTDGDYFFTLGTLVSFLESYLKIYRVRGIYNSDAAAAADGVTIGQLYEAAAGHLDGLPEGTLKIRRQ